MAVSVIMPVFNVERWIGEAIQSIRDQDFAALELIVVDDGSTDGSAEIAAEHARADPRVRVLQVEERGGSANARNFGVDKARYDLIAMMDADDVADRNRLSRQVAVFRERVASGVRLGALGAWERLIDGAGKVLTRPGKESTVRGDVTDRLARANCLIHSTVVMSREAFLAAGRYRREFQTAQDYDLWLRIREKHRLEVLPETLLSYRLHEHAASVVAVRRQIIDALLARACAAARGNDLPEPLGTDRPDDPTLARLVKLPVSFDFYLAKELSKRARHFSRFGAPSIARQLRKEAMEVFRANSAKWPMRQRAEILVRLGQSLI